MSKPLKKPAQITSWDERRNFLIPGDQVSTLDATLRYFLNCYLEAVQAHGFFSVALSGGSTPKTLYEHLTSPPYAQKIDWAKVYLFFGDERSVPPDHPDSNYHMAMQAGFKNMPIPKEHIIRMQAEADIEKGAQEYEKKLRVLLKGHSLDFVLLGMGEDGHTASLFPYTAGLKEEKKWVIANYVPQKKTWRMSLTFKAINEAKNIVIYVCGAAKKHILKELFHSKEDIERYPIQHIGTRASKALWILDEAAASELLLSKSKQ